MEIADTVLSSFQHSGDTDHFTLRLDVVGGGDVMYEVAAVKGVSIR